MASKLVQTIRPLQLVQATTNGGVRRMISNKTDNGNSTAKTQEGEKEEGPFDPHLPPWPEGINPQTGERGGPKGPEPTRYGDWERKGRVSDF